MSELSRFFRSVHGDRVYTAQDWADYFNQFIRSGVYHNEGGPKLQVKATGTDMRSYVEPGSAYLQGYMYKNTENLYLEHDGADPILNRIDRVVLRANTNLEERNVKAMVLKGEPALAPEPPAITREFDENGFAVIFDLSLAQVLIPANTGSIDPSNITDERLNNEVCGIATHLFEQVDTTSIFNEWQNYLDYKKDESDLSFNDFKAELQSKINDFQQEWEAWFNEVQDTTNLVTLTQFNQFKNEALSQTPLNVMRYNSIAQWSDLFIPNEARGEAVLEYLLQDEESSMQIANSPQAMLVIMEEERFNKDRPIIDDYEQMINKIGRDSPVGQNVAWIEELLANHNRGIEKLELGLMDEAASNEIASNKYAMQAIMMGENIIKSYRV